MIANGKEGITGKWQRGGIINANENVNELTQKRLNLSFQTCEKKAFEISSWLHK